MYCILLHSLNKNRKRRTIRFIPMSLFCKALFLLPELLYLYRWSQKRFAQLYTGNPSRRVINPDKPFKLLSTICIGLKTLTNPKLGTRVIISVHDAKVKTYTLSEFLKWLIVGQPDKNMSEFPTFNRWGDALLPSPTHPVPLSLLLSSVYRLPVRLTLWLFTVFLAEENSSEIL